MSRSDIQQLFSVEQAPGQKPVVIANGNEISVTLPATIEQFLLALELLPRSVVVEHNGAAVAPSEFSIRQLCAGDRLEIVKVVAGG
jgi:sulfur carrier protein